MTTEVEKFDLIGQEFGDQTDISDEVKEANVEKVKDINFLCFSLKDIEKVENCQWLPTSFIVKTLREWMKTQDSNTNAAMSYLGFVRTIDPQLLNTIVNSIFVPANTFEVEVTDIIDTIATANKTRPHLNPVETGIIHVKSLQTMPKKELSTIFSGPNKGLFNATPSDGNFALFEFPPFLSVHPTSYKLKSGPKNFPTTWKFEASVDSDKWEKIDEKTDDTSLCEEGKEVSFPVQAVGYFRFFRITQTGTNHNQNKQLVFAGFDISGYVKLN